MVKLNSWKRVLNWWPNKKNIYFEDFGHIIYFSIDSLWSVQWHCILYGVNIIISLKKVRHLNEYIADKM